MKALILLLISCLFYSCSNEKPLTPATVSFALGASVNLSVSGANGAKFFGRSSKGDAFMMDIPLSNDKPIAVELKNGKWDFYAMTWENIGSPEKFTGKVRCANALQKDLTGGDVDIHLNLSNQNCSSGFGRGFFYDHDTNPTGTPDIWRFSKLQVMPILPNVTVGSYDDCSVTHSSVIGTSSGICSTVLAQALGVARLYNFIIPNFKKEGPHFDHQVGTNHATCVDVGANGYATVGGSSYNNNLNISEHMPMILSVGYDGDCSGGYGLSVPSESIQWLTDGYKAHGGDFISHEDTTAGASTVALYHKSLPEFVCGGGRKNANGLVGGRDSSPAQPFAICSEKQFNSIGNDPVLLSANLVLMSDLNFDLYDHSTVCSQNEFFPMKSFLPIGGNLTINGNTCDFHEATPTSEFTGVFLGYDHTIYNARYNDENLSGYVGLFRKVGMDAKIINLKIKHAEMRTDLDDAGALAGKIYAGNGNPALVENVTIEDAQIESKGDYSGGAVGYNWYVDFHRLIVKDTFVRVIESHQHMLA